MFLHPILAFVAPLLVTEELCTNSSEVGEGLPLRFGNSLRRHPGRWLGGLMILFGLMQFINSPSAWISFASGSSTSLCLGLVLFWWRKTGGAAWSMRELLPQGRSFRLMTGLLALYYLFWSWAIKREALPPIWPGQIFIWLLYAGLIMLLARCVGRMEPAGVGGREASPRRTFHFTWRGFIELTLLATVVTTLAEFFLKQFGGLQFLLFGLFYVVAGILLLGGAIRYACRHG